MSGFISAADKTRARLKRTLPCRGVAAAQAAHQFVEVLLDEDVKASQLVYVPYAAIR